MFQSKGTIKSNIPNMIPSVIVLSSYINPTLCVKILAESFQNRHKEILLREETEVPEHRDTVEKKRTVSLVVQYTYRTPSMPNSLGGSRVESSPQSHEECSRSEQILRKSKSDTIQ